MSRFSCTTTLLNGFANIVECVAYWTGESLNDGFRTHDYNWMKKELEYSELLLPEGVICGREQLWNEIQLSGKWRSDRIARKFELVLPVGLTLEQRRNLAKDFAENLVKQYSVAADVSVHVDGYVHIFIPVWKFPTAKSLLETQGNVSRLSNLKKLWNTMCCNAIENIPILNMLDEQYSIYIHPPVITDLRHHWIAVENAEKLNSENIKRKLTLTLPVTLNSEERKKLIFDFSQFLAKRYYAFAETTPVWIDDDLILRTTIVLIGKKFGTFGNEKLRKLGKFGDPEQLEIVQTVWRIKCHEALQCAGSPHQFDHPCLSDPIVRTCDVMGIDSGESTMQSSTENLPALIPSGMNVSNFGWITRLAKTIKKKICMCYRTGSIRYLGHGALLFLFLASAGNSLAGQPGSPSASPYGKDGYDIQDILELPPLSPVTNARLPLTPKEKAALRLQKSYTDRNVPPVIMENGRVTYAYGMTTPSVVCAPYQVSDIELQPGELVNDVVLGDTARWKLSLARSGSPEASHIVIKPLDAGLETTAVITTDRRVYHIQFKSQPQGHMAYVGFVYPEDAESSLREQIAAQRKAETWRTADIPAVGATDMSKLSFAYRVEGDARWKPVQVFNDGRQTFIRLPETVSQSELPVLLVRRNGGDVLVNYRLADETLVVDDIFDEAVLLAGVGGDQEKITIRRKQ